MAAVQRKELKRPDAFVTTGRRWLEWSVTHQRNLAFVAAGLAVVVLLAAGVNRYQKTQVRQANEDLAAALMLYKDEQWGEAATRLREVADRWGDIGVALTSRFYAAQADLEAGNLDGAREAFEQLSTKSGVPTYLRQQALFGLGFIAAQGGDDAVAATKYAEATAVGGPYTAAALLGEGRARVALGETDKAKEIYRRYLSDFPNSPERTAVEGLLAGL